LTGYLHRIVAGPTALSACRAASICLATRLFAAISLSVGSQVNHQAHSSVSNSFSGSFRQKRNPNQHVSESERLHIRPMSGSLRLEISVFRISPARLKDFQPGTSRPFFNIQLSMIDCV
jgi:hypothetical protein